MTLICIRHYYESGTGNNTGDVWGVVDKDKDWTEEECRSYVSARDAEVYVLAHSEASRPSYYMMAWSAYYWLEDCDGGKYDYDGCPGRDLKDSGCKRGKSCAECAYEHFCWQLQREQDVAYIMEHGQEL